MTADGADETTVASLRFDGNGLIPVIVSHAGDGTVMMFAYMNNDALQLTISSGLVHFYSRSRQKLWKKGETSGEMFAVKHVLVDCDQDVLLIKAEPMGRGNACHTGRKSCFYRELKDGSLRFL